MGQLPAPAHPAPPPQAQTPQYPPSSPARGEETEAWAGTGQACPCLSMSWATEQAWDSRDIRRAGTQAPGFKGEEALDSGCRGREERGRVGPQGQGAKAQGEDAWHSPQHLAGLHTSGGPPRETAAPGGRAAGACPPPWPRARECRRQEGRRARGHQGVKCADQAPGPHPLREEAPLPSYTRSPRVKEEGEPRVAPLHGPLPRSPGLGDGPPGTGAPQQGPPPGSCAPGHRPLPGPPGN